MAGSIFTERLELRPMSAAFMQAIYDERREEAEALELVTLPPGWDFGRQWLPGRITRVLAVPDLAQWSLRAVILRHSGQVTGHLGFHEPPGMHPAEPETPGVVEFGYGTAPSFRRRGYAFEAAQGLMDWAVRLYGVRDFRLSIALDNLPSQRLAEKLGFTRQDNYVHPLRGLECLYRLHIDAAAAGK